MPSGTKSGKRAGTDLKKLCICEPCPSFTECMRAGEERLFCMEGKSGDCMFDKKGCSCTSCPVRADLKLSRWYYCIFGSEREQH